MTSKARAARPAHQTPGKAAVPLAQIEQAEQALDQLVCHLGRRAAASLFAQFASGSKKEPNGRPAQASNPGFAQAPGCGHYAQGAARRTD
jgi:hypothetical protein